jgi:RNA polymerase sigma-70 factor (ECF subfamily)
VEGTVVLAPRDSPSEFRAWVTPHLVVMARVAARLAPDADRDDVLQDALTVAWRRQSTFDPAKGTAAAWLCTVVANVARHAGRRRREAPMTLVPEPPDVPASEADSDLAMDVAAAMARLSVRQREAVDLHYYAGLSVAETASVMGVSAGTVKSTLFDARARLRELLGE